MFQRTIQLTFLALAGLACAGAASAARHEKVTECVDLSQARSFQRAGTQHLYIADGGDHYRLSFMGNACGPMRNTSKLELRTGETTNRICPQDTRLRANGHNCRVSGIERLTAEDYQRLTRKRRST